jgi:L-ascorbate metabolism protein UlaG (beta-lactamase superfamily)
MSLVDYETDVLATSTGDLEITCLGHGSLLLTHGGSRIYVDPFSRVADYSTLPKADLVLITHDHHDHLDPEALALIRTDATDIICTEGCTDRIEGGMPMRNGDVAVIRGLRIEAIPAYNLVHCRENGDPFHPCDTGNGYVITFGDFRVLVAGDTENTPELKAQAEIDVAFLPMNVPYTMTPAMVADVAIAMKPRILYPYHFGSTDPSDLVELLRDHPEIEIRIRSLA